MVRSRVPRIKRWFHEGSELVRFVPIGAIGELEFVEVVDGNACISIQWDSRSAIFTLKRDDGLAQVSYETASDQLDSKEIWKAVKADLSDDGVPVDAVEFDHDAQCREEEHMEKLRAKNRGK